MSEIYSTQDSDPSGVVYWRLIAIALYPERDVPELYALVREGRVDEPLLVEGRIALFSDRARSGELVRRYGQLSGDEVLDVDSPFVVCDVAQALHLLSSGGQDSASAVLNTVNVLLDFAAAAGVVFDERRKRALEDIANYCTTKYDVSKYLEEEGDYSSQELVDAVIWCVGVVVVMSRIV